MAEKTAQQDKTNAPRVVNAEGSSRYANKRGAGNRPERKPDAPKEFEEITISIDRVARVVKGGRRFRFKALVAIGNKKNKVGVGVAKGQDVTSAVTKATDRARKNMITINIDRETIPHEVEEKVTGAVVLMKPAAPDTGVIAGGVVRSIIGLTGIKNLISKSLGSTNKVNIAYAVIKGLDSLVPKSKWHLNQTKQKEEK
jgi:small subunit ribosomal protein S5